MTMKKTYKNPVMEIIKFSVLQTVLTTSNMGNNGNYGSGSGITLGGREDDGDDW